VVVIYSLFELVFSNASEYDQNLDSNFGFQLTRLCLNGQKKGCSC